MGFTCSVVNLFMLFINEVIEKGIVASVAEVFN